MFAHDLLLSGNDEVIVAGAMGSMTNAPYLPRTEGEQAGADSGRDLRRRGGARHDAALRGRSACGGKATAVALECP
jgi:acetyl-CoA acetyltransferase